MNCPILSICIPTYNRATYLDETIKSIVVQKRFLETNDVEIVISDNCSQDETEAIVKKYIDIFAYKIRYYKNPSNIKDGNFEKVLSYGNGIFLKLNNDTLNHKENTLDVMIDVIYKNINSKRIIFFSNGTSGKNLSSFICKDINSFVEVVSYWSTWIACFGIWKIDFETLNEFSRYSNLQLVQTDVLLRLISSGKEVHVDNTLIFNSVTPSSKGGYNPFKTFGIDYLSLYTEYIVKGELTKKIFNKEKYKLFRYFLLGLYCKLVVNSSSFTFDTSNAFKNLLYNYRFNLYFYLWISYTKLRCKVRNFLRNSLFKKIYKSLKISKTNKD